VVATRAAKPEDLTILLALWDELRQVGGRAERAVNPVTTVDVGDHLRQALTDPDCRVTLACASDEPAGMAVMRVVRPDPLSDSRVVHVVHLVVARQYRHHGIGHALVASAAEFAAERHVDHVAVSVYPSLRDTNRFYARLGFAPIATRRIVPVGVLRRRLDNDRTAPLLADTIRRRTRIAKPVPPQRVRRGSSENVGL
jgi:ribosomal protein S18 acetylase RimI-like enzyme